MVFGRLKGVFVTVCFVFFGFASDVCAQGSDYFERGAKAYQAGEFASAVVEFRKSYELKPDGITLYNIALCYIGLEKYGEAERYLNRARAEFQTDVEGASVRVDGRLKGVYATTVAHRVTAEMAEITGTMRKASVPVDLNASHVRQSESSGWSWRGWTGVGLLGVAAVGSVVAVVLQNSVQEDLDGLSALQSDAYRNARDDVESRQNVGRVVVYATAGVAVMGVVLVIWELISGDTNEAAYIKTSNSAGSIGWQW